MRKLFFALMICIATVAFADTTPCFKDTVGFRDYAISVVSDCPGLDIPEHKAYILGLLNTFFDSELPQMQKKIDTYNELASEYQTLSNNDKLQFLKKNRLKILDLGFKELTTIEKGDKAFGTDNHKNICLVYQARTMADLSEYMYHHVETDIKEFVAWCLIIPTKWDDFLNGCKKFGITTDRAVKIANDNNLYEDIDGYMRYCPPAKTTKPTHKKMKRKNRRK